VTVRRTPEKGKLTDLQLQVLSEKELCQRIQDNNSQNHQIHRENHDGSYTTRTLASLIAARTAQCLTLVAQPSFHLLSAPEV
jgi:hypothetical protein